MNANIGNRLQSMKVKLNLIKLIMRRRESISILPSNYWFIKLKKRELMVMDGGG